MPFLATATSGSSSGYGGYLILLLPLLLLAFLFWSQRRRTKSTQQQQQSVTVGSEVVTTSGIYGTVIAVQDPVIALEVASGVTLHVDRRAVLPRGALAGRTPAGATPPPVPAGRYGELQVGGESLPAAAAPEHPTTYTEAVEAHPEAPYGTDDHQEPGAGTDTARGDGKD